MNQDIKELRWRIDYLKSKIQPVAVRYVLPGREDEIRTHIPFSEKEEQEERK